MTTNTSPPPEISVVIPTHQRAERLSILLNRLRSQRLNADLFEVIVVDDCSTDDTEDVFHDLAPSLPFRARLARTPSQQGPAGARNQGWRMAAAPLLAFIDDDVNPAPGWLEAGLAALLSQPGVGVLQGLTRMPPEDVPLKARYGPPEWDHFHAIESATPFFQACNIFFRREALEQTGGFDEEIGWWGEDTAAGWKTLAAGWDRAFAHDAMVSHPVERRGWRWFMRNGALEYNIIQLGAEYPEFRASAFWRPWAYRKEDAAFKVALVGVVLGLRFRPALVLALPYIWWQRPSIRHLNFFRLCWQIPLVDGARSIGQVRAAIDYRVLVI